MRARTLFILFAIALLSGCASVPPSLPAIAPAPIPPGPRDATILVTEKGDVYAWGTDLAQPPLRRRVDGDVRVRSVVLAPQGQGVLMLVDEWRIPKGAERSTDNLSLLVMNMIKDVSQTMDWSSRIVWVDPWAGKVVTVFDSYADRWSGQSALASASMGAGKSDRKIADNDLTELYEDAAGRVFFKTEEGLTYRMEVSGGKLSRLELVAGPAPSGPEPERRTIQGLEGIAVTSVAGGGVEGN